MENAQNTAYKTFKQSFDSSNSLWVIAVLNVKIGPKCHKDWVLGQNTFLTAYIEPQKIYSLEGCHEIAFLGTISHNGAQLNTYY